MGRIFLSHLGGSRIFLCASCETPLTNRAELISTRFTGATGRAFLFNRVVNLSFSEVQVFGSQYLLTSAFCLTEWLVSVMILIQMERGFVHRPSIALSHCALSFSFIFHMFSLTYFKVACCRYVSLDICLSDNAAIAWTLHPVHGCLNLAEAIGHPICL